MADFFRENLDYIFFCYGLAFMALAAVCFSLQKAERERLPWRALGLFGLIHSIAEWTELTALQLGDSVFAVAARYVFMTTSFLFLMEFGRGGGVRLRGKGPGRWILLLPLAFAAAGGAAAGWVGLNAATRYALAFPAGLWAANTLCRYAGTQAAQARLLLTAATLLTGLYAFASGLVVPAAPFFPASLINGDAFFRVTDVPIQLIRALLASGIAFLIYAYSEFPLLKSADWQPVRRDYRNLHRSFALAIAAILAAGWIATHSLGRFAHDEVIQDGKSHMAELESHMTLVLSGPERTVHTLALSPPIVTALVAGSPAAIDLANRTLDKYREVMDVLVCYLLDSRGTAIASSNRFMPDSFVGHSYAFRHYYLSAAAGNPAFQFALGVTSGERGYYTSHPVVAPDGKIAGVAVIKQRLDRTEAAFPKRDPVFFINPEGVIFLSHSAERRFMGLWPIEAEVREKLIAGRQFGPGPFPALLSREPKEGDTITLDGRSFLVMRKTLNREGWSLVSFETLEKVQVYRFVGIVITFALCILTIGMSIFFKSSLESTARIAISEGRFRAIFENAPGAIFIVDPQTHRILQLNPFLSSWLGYRDEELLVMTLEDLRAADGDDAGRIYRKKDGSLADVEETRTPIHFHGKEALLIIAHDISDHKRVQTILQDLSRRDGLTGLANRRHFDESLEREWKRALREKDPLSIIMCDIDFFKDFNDLYGHQSGDDCLRSVARVLDRVLHRPLDVAARYGGEEFVVVLPGTDREGALAVAESIRGGIEALAIPHASSQAAPVVTISLGVASGIPAPDGAAAEMLTAADRALYRAKGEGRNRISL
jgi:diguanylate cyclase (GGDEF)-like protein